MLVTTIASDSHTWNLVYLQLLLEEMGHEVTNLGACVPVAKVVEECALDRPDLVVVSSVNGMANLEAPGLVAALRARPELRGLPVVVGGQLGTLGPGNRRYAPGLLAAGFDAVFTADEPIDRFTAYCGRLARVGR
ncbi:cobalamin B12-binding domain-containing protein [Actinomadura atramentaria]|uniref:cobalamin B12-binding domain-containing protein n=1 Tax=Actinomadura atramentaria TaxID=1990 RepID=UPI000374CB0C|nr:cobalamin-dependent protein [Actinomadura atramentaria]